MRLGSYLALYCVGPVDEARDEQGRWTGGGPVSAGLSVAQAKLEGFHSTGTVERMIVVDADTGHVLQDYLGDRNSADRSTFGGGQLHLDRRVVEMHTHPYPDDSSFSDGDWKSFSWSNVEESRVVATDHVYTLTKTKAWDEIPWQEKTPAKIYQRWNAILDEKTGADWDGDTRVIHDVNRQMAKEFGVRFTEKARR